jgi:DNA-binding protein H-NS
MQELDTMSLDELKAHKKDVDKAIDSFEKRQRKLALEETEKVARQHGFSLAELTNLKGSIKVKSPPKYAHPDNAEMTWSGRGRKPQWVHDALDQGKSLEDFLIEK